MDSNQTLENVPQIDSDSNAIAKQYENTYPALEIDFDLCEAYLDQLDGTSEQKRELIAAIWSLVVALVDLGIGIHPAQLANTKSCEQNALTEELKRSGLSDVIRYVDRPKTKFIEAADNTHCSKREESINECKSQE